MENNPKEMNSGQCHCGESKYQTLGSETFNFLCFCSDCKVLFNGRLHGVIFFKEGFQFSGPLKTYIYPGGSGEDIHYYFCSKCSTGMFSKLDKHPEIIVTRGSTLHEYSKPPKKISFENKIPSWEKKLFK